MLFRASNASLTLTADRIRFNMLNVTRLACGTRSWATENRLRPPTTRMESHEIKGTMDHMLKTLKEAG